MLWASWGPRTDRNDKSNQWIFQDFQKSSRASGQHFKGQLYKDTQTWHSFNNARIQVPEEEHMRANKISLPFSKITEHSICPPSQQSWWYCSIPRALPSKTSDRVRYTITHKVGNPNMMWSTSWGTVNILEQLISISASCCGQIPLLRTWHNAVYQCKAAYISMNFEKVHASV